MGVGPCRPGLGRSGRGRPGAGCRPGARGAARVPRGRFGRPGPVDIDLAALVAGTFDDLYFTLTVSGLFLTPWSLAKGLLLGLGVTWLAALAPALAAARITPGALQRRSAA